MPMQNAHDLVRDEAQATRYINLAIGIFFLTFFASIGKSVWTAGSSWQIVWPASAAAIAFLFALFAWSGFSRTIAATCLLLYVAANLVAGFGQTGNHVFLLGWLAIGIIVAGRNMPSSQIVGYFRATFSVVLAGSALQKLSYNSYFFADVFSWLIASGDERVIHWLGFLYAPTTLQHLQQAGIGLGAGPFAVRDFGIVGLSNSIWLIELLMPLALYNKRLRKISMLVAVIFLSFISLVFKESSFAVVMVVLLASFGDRSSTRLLLPMTLLLGLAATLQI